MITLSALSCCVAVTWGDKEIFYRSEMAAPIEGKFKPRSEPFFSIEYEPAWAVLFRKIGPDTVRESRYTLHDA